MEEIIAKYPDSEESLYIVSGMICQNCTDDLELFAAHKKKYTLEYVNGILKWVEDAEAIPNQDQRQSAQNMLRNALAAAKNNTCNLVLYFMTFITTDGFPEENIEALKKEAGDDYYVDATRDNWKSARTMNRMVIDFVKKYSKELSDADLPAEFITNFTNASAAFNKALSSYNAYKLTAERLTASKLTANNKVYTAVQGILNDGKYIFRNDPAKLREYSYSALSRKVVHKKSGFHITLTNPVTTAGIEDAVITFVESDKTYTSNENGVMDVELAQGTYTYTITAEGYLPFEGTLQVDKNVMHRLDISLTAKTLSVEKDADVA